MAKETRKLFKVWFDELHPMEGNHFTGTRGMSPGGSIFEEGLYYEADLKEKSLVLHHSCKVVEKQDSVELEFEGGSISCLLREKVKRIEKVSRQVDVQSLHRKDLTVFWCRIPAESLGMAERFIGDNLKVYIDSPKTILGYKLFNSAIVEIEKGKKEKETPCFGYHVLVKTKNAKKFIKLFFAEKLTPPGRMWMVFQHHPSQPEARRLHPSI